MKKIISLNKIKNLFSIEEYRRDMKPEEKEQRDNKIAFFLLMALALVLLSAIPSTPSYASFTRNSTKFKAINEWKCPKEGCGYDNYDDIQYCPLCGTRKPAIR